MTKKKFIELTGEDPEDLFGPDWENYVDEYLEEHNNSVFANKFGRA